MKNNLILISLAMATTYATAQEPTPPNQQPAPPAPAAAPAPAPAPAPAVAPAPAPAPMATSTGDTDDGPFFGFKLTPTYNWLSVDREGYDSKGGYIGYTYGIMMDFKLAKNYFFATGIELSSRGGKYTSKMLDNPEITGGVKVKGEVTQRFQFVDVPLAIKLKTNEVGYSRYYASFGLLPGFMVKANEDKDYDETQYEDQTKRSNSSDFGIFSVGFNLGLGWEYRFSGNTALTLGLGYHNGFVDIWSIEKAKMTTNFLSLNLGMFF